MDAITISNKLFLPEIICLDMSSSSGIKKSLMGRYIIENGFLLAISTEAENVFNPLHVPKIPFPSSDSGTPTHKLSLSI